MYMNSYDLTIVLDGKTTAAKKKAAIEKIETLIKTFEGTLGEIKDLGEKDLAYQINKVDTGLFMTFPISFRGESAKKFQDKFRLEDYVLRYLMIKTEREEAPKEEAKKTTKKAAKKTEVKAEGEVNAKS
jgi:small subunit ribosomal protein S6